MVIEHTPTSTDPDTPESRKKRYAEILKYFKSLDQENIISNPEAKNKFIKNLLFTDFQKLLIRVNGMLRGIGSKKRQVDGQDVELLDENERIVYCPPDDDDKKELLSSAFDTLKRMGVNNDSAAMIASSIIAIQPFRDANGRTSRLLYVFLSSQNAGHDTLKNGFFKMQPLLERYIAEKQHKIPRHKPVNFIDDTDSNEQEQNYYHVVFKILTETDPKIMTTVLQKYCTDRKIDFDKKILDENNNFSQKKFFSSYDQNEVAQLVAMHASFKRQFIKTVIDVFEHPSKYIVSDVSFDDGYPFEEDIKKMKTEGVTFKDTFFKQEENNTHSNEGSFSWEKFMEIMQS